MIIISRAGGQVAIMTLVKGANVDEEIAKWKATMPNEYAFHAEVPDSSVPDDSTFHDALVLKGNQLSHNMERAREIARTNIRRERELLFPALDVAYARADEDGLPDAKSVIVARKQRLRDAPADQRLIDAASAEALKRVQDAVIAEMKAV